MRLAYIHILKFRWAMLTLVTLMTFVLISNANQMPPSNMATATNDTEIQRSVPTVVTFASSTQTGLSRDILSLATPSVRHDTKSVFAPPLIESQSSEAITSKHTVKLGDTLSGILDSHKVHSSLSGLLALGDNITPLQSIVPGNTLELGIKENKLISLVYEIPYTERLEIVLDGGRYEATKRPLATTKHEAHAFGIVTNSFYETGNNVGLTDKTIINMANILGWDIDFGLDVRKGDYFSVVYEEEYINGEKLRDGTIQAVEFINNGKTYRAVSYTDASGRSGYFSPDGRSMRKPFLRNPIEFSRISSHFNPKRLHPILKIVRPHRGIDYAAPHGTPIRATGKGKVIFAGEKSGYGNTVIINHGRTYSTLYAHLSAFARGISAGKPVEQTQVIGYVGATGYATGPHLHYEFRINNTHKNPLTVKLPDSSPLPAKEMARFREETTAGLAKLNTLKASLSFDTSPL